MNGNENNDRLPRETPRTDKLEKDAGDSDGGDNE